MHSGIFNLWGASPKFIMFRPLGEEVSLRAQVQLNAAWSNSYSEKVNMIKARIESKRQEELNKQTTDKQ